MSIFGKVADFFRSGGTFAEGFDAGYREAKHIEPSEVEIHLRAYREGYEAGYEQGRNDRRGNAVETPLSGTLGECLKDWGLAK